MNNRTTSTHASKSVSVMARESLRHLIPSSTTLAPLGVSSLDAHLGDWRIAANYVIAGRPDTAAEVLALTLAERFATNGGHVIWVGITDDLARLCERLTFKIAGLELPAFGSHVQLDAVAMCKLAQAHEQIKKMCIDFCNIEDCGDTDVEQEFLASVSSFRPTLIVVDESIFDKVTLNPFEILVRQTHALRMVEELRETNPVSSVLWQLSLSHSHGEVGENTLRPSIDDLPDAAKVVKPDVVLFTHSLNGSDNAEVIVAANAYGPIGTVPMILHSKHLTWQEIDAAA